MESFKDQRAYCSNKECIVYTPCSRVKGLKDFGLRIGSLNDTLKNSGPEITGEAKNDGPKELRRGASGVELHESKPMFFRIPYQSYLIPGPQVGLEADTCSLSIAGFIPDEENYAVLGQPFLQNYYAVLDQDSMKIGLGAHIGTRAEIHDGRFQEATLGSIMLTLTLLLLLAALVFFVG
jgi:hypothetical protein